MDTQYIDSDGYLIDPMQWNEAWAEAFAGQENIDLTPIHWGVIRFMRRHYEEHRVAPDARFAVKRLAEDFGTDARNKLLELFPCGYARQACKIAGMKRPRAWSAG